MPKESEYWGGLEQNFVGTNEFIDLCRRTDAEPFLCVNVMTGTEDDAADWVAYCNAPQTHRVAMHRARSGSKEPFAVKYWELDNETFRKYDAIEYANRCVAFSKAMKAVDPSIKLVMVGYWRFRELLPQMLEIAGPHIDLVTDRAMDENYWHPLMKVVADYNAKTGRNIQLCNTEWLAPDEGVSVVPDGLNRSPLPADITFQNKAIRWHYAMNAAKQLLVFQRLGGDFVFSNFNNLANTWGQNVMECPKEAVFLSAAGRVFELLSVSPAAWILESSSTDETGKTEVQAAWNLDRNALTMTIVNYLDRKIAFNLDFRQLNFKPTRANVSTLFAESLASFNAVGAPDTIQREDSTQILDDFGKYTTDAPPYSVTHVVLE
jgi:alpha-N-arabinofuranosidase